MTTKALSARQVRWYEFIQEFYFALKYRPGRANVLADTLTRRKDDGAWNLNHRNLTMLPQEVLDKQIVSELAFMDLQGAVTDRNVIDRVLEANKRVAATTEAQEWTSKKGSKWHIEDGRLLFQGRLYVPNEEDLRVRLVDEIHRPPSTAHPGRDKMKKLIRERFYWESWNADVESYVDNCRTCGRTTTWRDRAPGLLQPLPIPERPWQHLSMDFMEFPKDRYGYDMVFVTVDRLREQYPCLATRRLQLPKRWHDSGLDMFSHGQDCLIASSQTEEASLYQNSGVRHAQTDGQTEIANQYLQQRLRPYVNFAMDDWSEYLPVIDFATSALPQASIGISPFMVEKGYQPRMSFDWTAPVPPRKLTLNEKEAQDWTKRIQDVWEFARDNIKQAQERQTTQANKKRRPVNFTVGDMVYVTNEGWDTGRPGRKLGHQQEGPFPVVRQVGHAFELGLPKGMRVHPIFAPEKLRLAATTEPLQGQLEDEGPELEVNGYSEWEVEKILASRIMWRKLRYRVGWLGRDPDPKWYPAGYLKNAPLALKAFHNANPKAPGPPERLREWIEAAEEDRYVQDTDEDDIPVTDARGQASGEGGGDVTAVR
ncbi:retrovirus polyprotein, putative [Talaromyces marneffei ATCC 18224]|uniref:Retrovirus polyprotein, putative n=1 Tax=Talaromyces marneffei (strain ATCC 18224 / CBS 334.59 / QM 7333) TaxID=441960 RepID=B6Q6T9_TALMQ|nr:retrovirus polyprotein, putative [Talaromyces marneffei ATCC 18224]